MRATAVSVEATIHRTVPDPELIGGVRTHRVELTQSLAKYTRAKILTEVGKRKMVGGQEDMIVDIALDMAKGG